MTNEKSWNEQLKDYVDQNYKGSLGKFVKVLEKERGIKLPSSTLYDYVKGRTRRITKENVANELYEFTKIESLKDAYHKETNVSKKQTRDKRKESELENLLKTSQKLINLVNAKVIGSIYYEPNIEERAEIFSNLVNTTIDQVVALSQYYRDNPKDIENLTKIIAKGLRKEDVGYLISALNAMFEDDKFKSWVLMADYRPRKRK